MNQPDLEEPPWYRQFWPWLLIAIPATTVVAGIATIWIASREPVALVHDDYYKEGLAVNQDLARDRTASELGLRARLRFDQQAGTVMVTLGGTSQDTVLTLAMIHPQATNRDQTVVLQRTGTGDFAADLAIDQERWYLELQGNQDPAWRLAGEVDLRATRRVDLTSDRD